MGKPQELGISSLHFLYSFINVSSYSQKFVKALEPCVFYWLFLFQALSLLGLLLFLLWVLRLAFLDICSCFGLTLLHFIQIDHQLVDTVAIGTWKWLENHGINSKKSPHKACHCLLILQLTSKPGEWDLSHIPYGDKTRCSPHHRLR